MYCSNCGKDIPDALNYCNLCGAPTRSGHAAGDVKLARTFAIGAGVFAMLGIGSLFPLMRMLLDSRLDPASIGTFVMMYLVTVLLIFGVLAGMSWKLASPGRRKDNRQKKEDEYRPPASLRGVDTAQLHPGDPTFGSVTDSTTRTLDEVLIERKS